MSCIDRKYALLRCNKGKWQAYSICSKEPYENKNVSDKYVYVFDNKSCETGNNPFEKALNKKHELDENFRKIKSLKYLGCFTKPYEDWDVYRLNSKKCPIELVEQVDKYNNFKFIVK